MVYKFRISRPRQSQPARRVGRRAYYILYLAVSCVDSKKAANMIKLLSIVYLHGVVACWLAAAAWCARFFVSYSHLFTERSPVQKSPIKTKQNKANRRSSFIATQRVDFCSLTHRPYLFEIVLWCCDIDILHALYYIRHITIHETAV